MNAGIDNGGNTMSFWRLLKHYSIRIPAIQRDYVQGRGDVQSANARTGMLDDIQTHISDRTPMSLNFIYGQIEGSDDCDVELFVPLDGQQRLTTLYLIHWLFLVMAVANAGDGERAPELDGDAQTLGRFSYQTRQTSSDFFARIGEPDVIQQIAQWTADRTPMCKLSEYLRDKRWFRPDFMYDPTILSALEVLDDIDERRMTRHGVWDLLTGDDCPIRFEWLDVNDIGNGDDLYIKMNARGKQLSDFENIKAELEQKAQAEFSPEHYEEFCRKFDQEWTDFFWSFKGSVPTEKRDEYDMRFMGFLNWFLWNQWAGKAKKSPRINTEYSMKGVDLADTRHRSLDEYNKDLRTEGGSVCDSRTLVRLERILDHVSGDDALPGIPEIVMASSSIDGKAESYSTRMRLEAAVAYLDGVMNQGKRPEEQSWTEWIRVIRHLSNAATMWQGYNTLGLYAQAVGMVERYSDHADDLTSYLATFPGDTGFTPKDQIDEEELKAWLRANAPQWSEPLHKAEEIPYFEGKIDFLLSFAGITRDNVETMSHDPDVLDAFDKYLELTKMAFERQDTNLPDTSLLIDVRRALLTKGDYSMREGNLSYLVDSRNHARTLGWRNMLRASSGKRELFHRLCDDVLDRIGDKQLGRQDVVDALTAIADEYVWDEERTDVHAKSLIKEKGLWSHEYFGSLWQFRVVDGICYLPSGEKTQLNGINRELASCVICEELKNVIPDVQRTLKTRVGRLYLEWKPAEPQYLTLQKDGKIIHIGRKYVSGIDGNGNSLMSTVITVLDGDHEEQFSDVEDTIARIVDIYA